LVEAGVGVLAPVAPKWSRRVLLVEGADTDARSIMTLLEEVEGWTTSVARVRSLAEARATLATDDYDAVLLGCSLPDGEGVDAVVAISVAVPEIPIVALTNRGCTNMGLRAVQMGAQDYLDKTKLDAPALGQALRYAIERKRAEARLVYLAHYDQLTGLANRALFLERVAQALNSAPKHRTRVAVMFLDLDRFKAINDTRGHDAGDALLQQVAGRLLDCVREGETVARLGGDEFTILLEGVRRLDDATIVAQRIIDAFERPFDVCGRQISMSTSVGVAISADHVRTADAMMERADRAMYRAKQRGRNRFEISQDEPDISTGDLFDTTCEVERALATGELDVYYQPKVQLTDGRLVGMEALLRWNHPRLGHLAPSRFIPLMEQSGMIGEVGRWVLRRAMQQMKWWLDEGFGDFRVAVNVSARQLEDQTFVDTVSDLLEETALPARNLELEITESILIEQSARSHRMLEALQRLGVRLAMDDFGTGYSSLAYLVNYPIDILKIDKSFVEQLLTSNRHRAIVSAIVGLGRSLDLEIVAEGVETVEQLESLRDIGCRSIQGYLLSQPQASSDIEEWLDERTETQ
jgi:diguanylate cyclase (GGDEF)-like protein